MRVNFFVLSAFVAVFMLPACSDGLPNACMGISGVGKGVDKSKAVNDGEFVKFVYQAVLQREADGSGLKYHCELLKDGKVSRAGLIEAFSKNDEHKMLKAPQ